MDTGYRKWNSDQKLGENISQLGWSNIKTKAQMQSEISIPGDTENLAEQGLKTNDITFKLAQP